MTSKEQFIKNRISEMSNAFKVVAELSEVSIISGDIDSVMWLNIQLNSIFERIVDFAKSMESADIVKKVKDLNVKELPEYLSSLEIIDAYKKLLSLKYTNIETDNFEEKIKLNKMSIDYNWEEEIPYLIIARYLYEKEHYEEALKLCEYILKITSTAPVYNILGDIYRKLGEYGRAIENYKKYTEMNDGDDEAIETLNTLYEEALQ